MPEAAWRKFHFQLLSVSIITRFPLELVPSRCKKDFFLIIQQVRKPISKTFLSRALTRLPLNVVAMFLQELYYSGPMQAGRHGGRLKTLLIKQEVFILSS